jgi:CubicO group peptidase (beta-lactamase class C family)
MGNAWAARHGLTSSQYQVEFDKLVQQGYRLIEVDAYGVGGQATYAGIWEKVTGPAWVARHGLTGAQYQVEFDNLVNQGYRLRQVSGAGVGDHALYAAIWDKSPGPSWVARHGLSGAQYQAAFDNLVKQGYRLRHVDGYGVNGQAYYSAIWEKTAGPAWVARHRLTGAQYQAEFDNLVDQNYRLVDVSAYDVGGQLYYAAIFEQKGGRAWIARHGLTSSAYQGQFDNLVSQGFRLKWVTGAAAGNSAVYAALFEADAMQDADLALIDTKINAYMQQQSVPGLSIAITRNERLVYAEGFGHANTTTNESVTPSSLFRIASISKPVTAVAVMELVEAGKLKLDDTVFGPGAILGTTFGSSPYSNGVKSITVRHLLSHTSGWSNAGGDPMFANLGLSQAQLIGWVLDNRPLAKTPGTAYEYLNFGYCVLGRIIEKRSGQSYETFVKQAVLSGCVISRMRIGANSQAGKAAGEVTYYGGNPYGLLCDRMDAHGGWIATPTDLLRMMVRVDGFTSKADILSPMLENAMNTGSTANAGYGAGWIIDAAYRGHNGAMSGTIGFLVRRNDGFSFAVLANTRPAGDSFCFTLKGIIDSICTSVSVWPSYDLF